MVYAALYSIFGQTYSPIVVLNVILSTALVGLTMYLGHAFLDKESGLLAGLLMAIWPGEVLYVTILASELPFTFLVLLGCTVWFNARMGNGVRAVASGLVFGAATYVRPIALLMPIALWLSTFPRWHKLCEGLPVMIVAMIVIGITVAPWSVRNTRVFGHFMTLSTADGVNLWVGNNANSNGYYMPLPAATQGLSEFEQDKLLGEQARQYIIDHPGTFFLRCIKKAVLLHLSETIAVTWNTQGITQRFGEKAVFPLKLMTRGYWTIVLLFALGGVVILVRRHSILSTLTNPAVVMWLYFVAVYSVFFVTDRYHFPEHPFIAMLAASPILVLLASYRERFAVSTSDGGSQRRH